MDRHGKPRSEQGQIGWDAASHRCNAWSARSPGRLLEPWSDPGPRGMVVAGSQGPRQNPAYRPTRFNSGSAADTGSAAAWSSAPLRRRHRAPLPPQRSGRTLSLRRKWLFLRQYLAEHQLKRKPLFRLWFRLRGPGWWHIVVRSGAKWGNERILGSCWSSRVTR